MLSGAFHAAFSYISASNGSTGTGSRPTVQCSTAEEEGKSTAMSATVSSRQRLLQHGTMQGQGDRLKRSLVNPQVSLSVVSCCNVWCLIGPFSFPYG